MKFLEKYISKNIIIGKCCGKNIINNTNYIMLLMIFLSVFVFLFSFTVGKYSIPIKDLLSIFYNKLLGAQQNDIIGNNIILFSVRLPRIVIAMIIGSGLSVAGSAFQGVFKNPMASPDLLGASTGAGFGASLALLFGLNVIEVQFVAFIMGMIAVGFTYFFAKITTKDRGELFSLIITGLVISKLFSSFTSTVKYIADPDNKLPAITFWLMGGLSTITSSDVFTAVPFIIVGIIPILLFRWKINVLSLDDEEAKALGLNVSKLRALIICCATLITTASVSIIGIVGWVGLLIPHVARILVGADYRKVIPVSALIGGCYLLIVDDICRGLVSVEIPLGVLTAILGAPFFIAVMTKIGNRME